MAAAGTRIAQRDLVNALIEDGVVVAVVAQDLAIALGIDVLERPPAAVEQGVRLEAQLVDIARGMAVDVVDHGIGLAERIVALAARAVSDQKLVRPARAL